MRIEDKLSKTIEEMVDDHRGILAADESNPTMKKRLAGIGVESTEENRRAWRQILLTTTGLGDYISGIILFEETLGQTLDDGTPMPEAARALDIVPGIKVDKGKGPLDGFPGDLITYGLDGLGERLEQYQRQGARFAKWREVYLITRHNPTRQGRHANAEMLARYASSCQVRGIVPIVEPEVLMEGDHEIDRCARATEHVLHSVFHALHRYNVKLEYMILKPNMVLPGEDRRRAEPEEVAEATLKVLKRTVPAAVPSINFLSGGQSAEEATANLNAINQLRGNAPWQLSISYGRALQQPALHAWQGKPENVAAAQAELLKRARLNSLARQGKYHPDMEA